MAACKRQEGRGGAHTEVDGVGKDTGCSELVAPSAGGLVASTRTPALAPCTAW